MPKNMPGVLFPLTMTSDNAGYELADIREMVKFNLKNIILTNPGERIMYPEFGVGINALLFENFTPDIRDVARSTILRQISVYAPYVTLLELFIDPVEESGVRFFIKYRIEFAQIIDSFSLNISNI